MRFIFYIMGFFAILLAQPVHAKPIVADLALRGIDIDHSFDGVDILMFGARNDAGKIVVVVRGPEKKYVVRKKERLMGIWVNKETVEFDNVSGFYFITATNPLESLNNDQLLSSLGIGTDNLDFAPEQDVASADEFRSALIKNKQEQGLYSSDVGKVTFWGDSLFRTVLKFPKNIERGWYTAEVYLFSDGQLTSMQATPIEVRKTGFEAVLFDAAVRHSTLYGTISVMLAILAGWAANKIFGRR